MRSITRVDLIHYVSTVLAISPTKPFQDVLPQIFDAARKSIDIRCTHVLAQTGIIHLSPSPCICRHQRNLLSLLFLAITSH